MFKSQLVSQALFLCHDDLWRLVFGWQCHRIVEPLLPWVSERYNEQGPGRSMLDMQNK